MTPFRRKRSQDAPPPTATGGSLEALVGGFAAATAALGLSGYRPLAMAGIATIALGIALLAHGAATSARFTTRREHRVLGEDGRGPRIDVACGVTGLVLGALALGGLQPYALLPLASLAFGGGLVLGGGAPPFRARAASAIVSALGGAAFVLGAAGMLFGKSLVLAEIAMLVVGAALVVGGEALALRFSGARARVTRAVLARDPRRR